MAINFFVNNISELIIRYKFCTNQVIFYTLE
jgi:hypothetical protein